MGGSSQRPTRVALARIDMGDSTNPGFDWATPKYVSVTTFRRNGDAVATPVWFAPRNDGTFVFTTDPTSGKVKRLRNDQRVEVRPCSVRGAVRAGAPVGTGTATIIGPGSEYQAVVAALKSKYGWFVTVVELGGSIKQRLKRNSDGDCAIAISLDA